MTAPERDNLIEKIEKLILSDRKYFFTAVSYLAVILISVNLVFADSLAVGAIASLTFFMINGVFLAHAFFKKEDVFFRLMFGFLLLIMLLGFVGWLIMIIHNLDVFKFTVSLFIVATLSSSLNRRMKYENAT